MNHKPTLLTAAILMTLVAGSANAGVKDWLKDKKDKLTGHPQVEQITDIERADCKAFLAEQAKGKVPSTPANAAKNDRCSFVASQSEPTTLGTVEVKGQKPNQHAVDAKKTIQDAGKGCGGGVIAASVLAMLGGPAINPTIACGAGGLIGGGFSYAKQMKQAREVEAAANAAGMKATVKTETATVQGKPVEKLQGVVIEYDPADMARMDDTTKALLDRTASLAKKSKNTLTFTFEGASASCKIPMDQLKARGALDRHTAIDNCGKKAQHAIVITPVPEVD